MSRTLPERYGPYEEVLNRLLKEAARKVTEAKKAQAPDLPERSSPWRALCVGGPMVLACALLLARPEGGRLSTGRKTLFSAELLGDGTSTSDYLPTATNPSPSPSPRVEERTPLVAPRDAALKGSPVPKPSPCRECSTVPSEVLFDASTDGDVRIPALPPSPTPLLTAGTRISLRLAAPVVVGPGGVPFVADVLESGGPNGATQAVGEASWSLGDRATIAFSSLVIRGRSVPVTGVAIGSDGQLGLKGVALSSGSRGRRGLGKALHTLGTALSFGLLGSNREEQVATEAISGELSAVPGQSGKTALKILPGDFVLSLKADAALP